MKSDTLIAHQNYIIRFALVQLKIFNLKTTTKLFPLLLQIVSCYFLVIFVPQSRGYTIASRMFSSSITFTKWMFHEREKHSCASLTHTITEKERDKGREKKWVFVLIYIVNTCDKFNRRVWQCNHRWGICSKYTLSFSPSLSLACCVIFCLIPFPFRLALFSLVKNLFGGYLFLNVSRSIEANNEN